MARDAYKSEKRRKELERQKKQAEKRDKRLKKNEERTEAEVLADLFGVPYSGDSEAGGAADSVNPEQSDAEGTASGEPVEGEKPAEPTEPADPTKG